MNLNELARDIHDISKSKGFWPKLGRNVGEVLMLIVTEVAEAMEAYRDGSALNEAKVSWHSTPDSVRGLEFKAGDGKTYGREARTKQWIEMGPEEWRKIGYASKPTGFPSEMADIIIRVLDACAAWNIDIEAALQQKIAYNATRPERHGRAR